MPWNYLEARSVPEKKLIVPVIGQGGYDRPGAVRVVQGHLDRSSREPNPAAAAYAELADVWRRGAKDDTIFLGPYTWAVYSHEPDKAKDAAEVWLTVFMTVLRANGRHFGVAPLAVLGG